MALNSMIGFSAVALPDQVNQLVTGGRLQADELAEITAYVAAAPGINLQLVRDAVFLAASAPSAQMF